MIKQRSKYKNLLALLLVFVMAIGTFIHYVPEMPEVEASDANARPVFDSRHQTGYAVTGVTSSDSTSTYENGVVNIAQNVTNTWFTTELPSDASYYARMYVNVGLTRTMSITFRGTGWDHYLKLQPNSTTPTNSTCVINYGGESKTITGCDMTDIRSAGVYVTYYSSPSGVKVWLDDVYLGEIEAQVTDSANPGIKQVTGSATVSDIQIWRDIPSFNNEVHTGYAVTGVTSSDSTSTYENGVVNIAQNVTNTWFTTELPSDASYYARMYVNVGLTRTMSITFRGTGWDHYLKLQPNSTTPTNSTCVINYGDESKTITGCDMTDIRSAGVYVTYYSSPSGVKVWLDDVYLGEIEAQVTDSANPGIKQATGSATVSNIQLWTVEQMNPEPEPDPTPTGPVYDSALHTLYPVSAVAEGSSFVDGVVTVPANTTNAWFTSTLPADASYYARMNIKTANLQGTISVTFRHTGWRCYLQINPTNNTCTIYYGENSPYTTLEIKDCNLSQLNTSGVYITYYSTPKYVKVWLDGTYLGEVKAATTHSVNPGIKEAKSAATISDIQLWTVNNLYDISEYRTADGDYTHPTKEDYVFGGWYTDTTYTTPIDEATYEGEFYAKWVAEEVLSVKAQLPAPTPVDANGRTIMRFVTTVDCDDYSEIGFDVSTKNQSKTYTDTRFFSSIQSRYDSIKVDYTPSGEFHETSKLFATIILTNLKATDDHLTKEFTIKPFWKTADGTKVYGVTRVLTIQEGIDAMNQTVNPYSL